MTSGESFHYATGMSLLETTRKLLDQEVRATSLAEIARNAGPPVAYDWLKRFASGEIPDPSVNRVQALHDYLRSLRPAKH